VVESAKYPGRENLSHLSAGWALFVAIQEVKSSQRSIGNQVDYELFFELDATTHRDCNAGLCV
jgi:hypothetical protein